MLHMSEASCYFDCGIRVLADPTRDRWHHGGSGLDPRLLLGLPQ